MKWCHEAALLSVGAFEWPRARFSRARAALRRPHELAHCGHGDDDHESRCNTCGACRQHRVLTFSHQDSCGHPTLLSG